jgi:tRNA(adenine34) deaminase
MTHDSDEAFMRLAYEEAIRARLSGEVPVGAVLVGNDKEIISRAHNLCETLFDPTAHAEIIAIREAAKKYQSVRINQSTIYVTLEPCSMCIGAIVLARLKRLVFAADDPKSGAVVSNYNIGSDGRLNHIVEVSGGVLERECAELLRDFFQGLRVRDTN